jgi:hypothetical protein
MAQLATYLFVTSASNILIPICELSYPYHSHSGTIECVAVCESKQPVNVLFVAVQQHCGRLVEGTTPACSASRIRCQLEHRPSNLFPVSFSALVTELAKPEGL